MICVSCAKGKQGRGDCGRQGSRQHFQRALVLGVGEETEGDVRFGGKIANLRFPDEQGKMNLSVKDADMKFCRLSVYFVRIAARYEAELRQPTLRLPMNCTLFRWLRRRVCMWRPESSRLTWRLLDQRRSCDVAEAVEESFRMQVKRFNVKRLGVNCYVVYHQGESVVADPGGSPRLSWLQQKRDWKTVAIINTHTMRIILPGMPGLLRTNVFMIHEADAAYLSDPNLHLDRRSA